MHFVSKFEPIKPSLVPLKTPTSSPSTDHPFLKTVQYWRYIYHPGLGRVLCSIMYVFKCLIINFQSHTSFSKSLNQTFTPPVKTQLLSNCGCFRFILLRGFLRSSAGIVRTGVSNGQKGGTGPTNHLNSYSNKTLKALFLFGNQNTSSKFWQLLNMF